MDINQFIENTERIFIIIGIIMGGGWTYFNYFRGRTFCPRLDLFIESKYLSKQNPECFFITYKIKNIGLSKVKFKHKGSALRVYSSPRIKDSTYVHSALWERLATFSVLSDHGWIESGETIYETRLVTIPQEFHSEDKLAIKASLRITSMSIIPIWRKGKEWNISDTIFFKIKKTSFYSNIKAHK